VVQVEFLEEQKAMQALQQYSKALLLTVVILVEVVVGMDLIAKI
jgi:hypothetical protein